MELRRPKKARVRETQTEEKEKVMEGKTMKNISRASTIYVKIKRLNFEAYTQFKRSHGLCYNLSA